MSNGLRGGSGKRKRQEKAPKKQRRRRFLGRRKLQQRPPGPDPFGKADEGTDYQREPAENPFEIEDEPDP